MLFVAEFQKTSLAVVAIAELAAASEETRYVAASPPSYLGDSD